ncbi:unnamed protein product [Adineta steineri]|uniref:AB hydrolase-1 domain-containing protein n=1 Tax=Adineta steineri TaxID=433720 RepID=A0A819H7P2_9BILA|nr:unnamed protein product [Adineta steineri]CAF3580520.1 unnamed protein product [Adineta steineri]CAF3897461.1 unnamed protein product [Adineta steineri]
MLFIWIYLLSVFHLYTFVDSVVQCEQKNVTVQVPNLLLASITTTESLATWFCWKQGTQLNTNTIVHLTIHGYTYDHTYWAFPYQSPKYCYVDYVIKNSNGSIVVLNIDRIGIGLSSKPDAIDVTIDSNANVISQLTTYIHNGAYQGIQFTNIILVSHSLGTLIAWTVASQTSYNQYIRGIIATGWLHVPNPVGTAAVVASIYPAQLDPVTSQQSVPLLYVTTNPANNTRQNIFYNINDADPNVIQLDDQTKHTGTVGELATLGLAILPTVTLSIPSNIPVLVVMGQYDIIFCAPLALSCDTSLIIKLRESSSYLSAIDTFVLPNSGHDINLHLNSQDWYEKALNWTLQHF